MNKILTIFHMMNGEKMIGYIAAEKETVLSIEQPLILMIQQDRQNGGIQMGLMPIGFPFYQDAKKQPKVVDFNRAAISYMHPLDMTNSDNKQISEGHRQNFSSVIMGAGVGIKGL